MQQPAIIKSFKKLIPEPLMLAYHRVCGFSAAAQNHFPARDMIVIGITGTKGKTSTANYIWSVLTEGGYKTGIISSANFRIGTEEQANPFHMTMPSPFFIQKKLKEMKEKGVAIVVMEMTSEGMKQYRHAGIPVDIAVFTNLTPEHLGSHKGDFEVYKKAKSPLFKALLHPKKQFLNKGVERTIIANADSEHSEYYLSFSADKKITFGIHKGDIRADDEKIELSIPGTFNVYNALPALIIGRIFEIPEQKIREGLKSLSVIPGRVEAIREGQNFSVFVDYAHEPAGLTAILETAHSLKKNPSSKIILLTGVIGGGRASRIPMIEIASKKADYIIITTEDPYDEDPHKLINELARAATQQGMHGGKNLFPITDRREAIQKALSLAQSDDIVLITGKGAETTMMTKAGAVSWNERSIVRELVKNHAHK